MRNRSIARLLAMVLAVVMLLGLVGCGGGQKTPEEAEGRKVIHFAASYVTAQVRVFMCRCVKTPAPSQVWNLLCAAIISMMFCS